MTLSNFSDSFVHVLKKKIFSKQLKVFEIQVFILYSTHFGLKFESLLEIFHVFDYLAISLIFIPKIQIIKLYLKNIKIKLRQIQCTR